MFKTAEKKSKTEDVDEAQNWMRITTYLSQVMNSLAKRKPDKIDFQQNRTYLAPNKRAYNFCTHFPSQQEV
jgi:hypothetical protein